MDASSTNGTGTNGPGNNGMRTNWAGNHAYRATRWDEPRSVDELRELVRASSALHGVGSRHSFNDVADSAGGLVSLRNFDEMEIAEGAPKVTVGAGVSYGVLSPFLHAAGYALHNLASLPQISVVGACATATHGSGEQNGNLATAVSALEFVLADGSVRTFSKANDGDRFAGAVVNLGALGVVTRITLDLEPDFQMSQDVFEDVPLAAILEAFDEIEAAGYSVSLFTDWRTDVFKQVWLKRRVDATVGPVPHVLASAKRATRNLHPIEAMAEENATEQRGIPGPWFERLPHFRMGATPSSGNELQTEYIVPRRHATEALRAVFTRHDRIAPLLLVTEVRAIAADDLWLSPCYQEAGVAIHFTWKPEWEAVRALLPVLEGTLEPFEAKPHWGKLFTTAPERLAELFPRMADFRALAEELDPEGKFRNRFIRRNIFGEPGHPS